MALDVSSDRLVALGQHDYGYEAHQAAIAHLRACEEAEEEGTDSPASGPYCGCEDCVVREILYAAWPIAVRGVLEAIERE